ncbi:hypothetical protein PPSIR1_01147 [Plesiocystis pacifica SIR-1]|uniref:Uncharacterized protein n=1 Tax=Plesiocystis pacifica SIR-1 TaxID=391625 RepID=A6GFM5_9BACT|nr:hypothetical protein [Plesiocystis pacifica]EDM75339.1 hypothetical protein PPSIR1_01147 [Plesiocystis pacifica SIR-1]
MSDHHHDPGGHELEAINTKLLFQLVGSLSIVTLLASMGVVQWFYLQQRELQDRNAAEGSFILKDYKAKMAEDTAELDASAKAVLADAGKMKAQPAYPGWVSPDTAAAGAAAAAKPAEAPAKELKAPEPAKPEPAPAEGEGAEGDAPAPTEEAKPAEEAKPEAPAKPAEAADAPAEGDKPEKPAKPEEAPAKPEPAKADGE